MAVAGATRRASVARVRRVLDDFVCRRDPERDLRADPLGLVHGYRAPADRELVAFLTASLAFGQVAAIRGAVGRVLRVLGPHPAGHLRGVELQHLAASLRGFRYRWLDEADLLGLLGAVRGVLREHGSLEALFQQGFDPADDDVGPGLIRFVEALRSRWSTRASRGSRFLLPSPRSGSACKRLCLFLRWVARPDDGVDLGLWKVLPPARLVLPLDTHLARIVRYLGLTRRVTPGWSMALDATHFLRRIAPTDPLRYEFALCHLGISGDCPRHRVRAVCRSCDLRTLCTLP